MILVMSGCTSKDNSSSAPPKTGSPSVGVAASGGASTSKGGAKRIILLNNTDSPFWDAARAGIKKAQEDLKLADVGLSASMDSNDGTETGQIEKLRQYGTQSDIVAVIISPISSTNPAIADELKKLKAKGVTVAVIYTEYVPLVDEPDFYTQISQAKIDQIEPNLKACASPGQFYKPGNGAQIASMMSDIVEGNAQTAVAAKTPRLVQ
jgi:hypothetical protein